MNDDKYEQLELDFGDTYTRDEVIRVTQERNAEIHSQRLRQRLLTHMEVDALFWSELVHNGWRIRRGSLTIDGWNNDLLLFGLQCEHCDQLLYDIRPKTELTKEWAEQYSDLTEDLVREHDEECKEFPSDCSRKSSKNNG